MTIKVGALSMKQDQTSEDMENFDRSTVKRGNRTIYQSNNNNNSK